MSSPTIAPASNEVNVETEKNDAPEVDGDGKTIDDAKAVNFVIDNSQEVSSYADWPFLKTIRHFWRSMAISFACGICAMGDGYQYKMPGNIVALKGFIRQMGTQDPETGEYALDSQHVAAWGGRF